MKKYIFLDVDGVLISYRNVKCFLDYAMLNLKSIVEKTQSEIILISTWRKHDFKCERLLKEFNKYKIPVWISSTYDLWPSPRSFEILSWLLQNVNKTENIKCVSIDDEDYDVDCPGMKCFRTSPLDGLTTEISENIINYLNSET